MFDARCMIVRYEAIESCPTIDGCRPLANKRVLLGRITYHVCYGTLDVEPEPFVITVTSSSDEFIHFSRDSKYILLMYSSVVYTYTNGDNEFYETDQMIQRDGKICVAQDLVHTAISLLKHSVNMQSPADNDNVCGDMDMVSINSTHAIRRAFWLGHGKMCHIDAYPILSQYKPYAWACTAVGSAIKGPNENDDPGWLERSFRSFTQWVAKEIDALVDWLVRFILKVVEFLLAELFKVLKQIWRDVMALDSSYYIIETLVLMFVVTYRSNLAASVILIVILFTTVGLKRGHSFRLMGWFDN